MNNHISILSVLIENGANVNATNKTGRTALIEAAARGHPAITLRLCQARPMMDFQNELHPLKLTALMEAASRGHDGVVFWLCEARAKIDLKNKWGDTALIMAANNNRLGSVLILLAYKADTTIRGDGGATALDAARAQGHTRIVEVFESPMINDNKYLQTLYTKFKNHQKDLLQEEVNYDASVSSRKLPKVEPTPEVPEWNWEESLELVPRVGTNQQQVITSIQEQLAIGQPKSILHTTPGTRPVLTGYRTGNIRMYPLQELPSFGTTVWVATEPTRTSRQSKTEKISHFESVVSPDGKPNDALHDNMYPVLMIKDDGTWKYTGDMLSGDLTGTFEMFHVMTVPSEMAIADPQRPELNSSDTISRIFYLIRLTAPPVPRASKSELQIVSFILGKQIVLGRLVMEMSELENPWWL